MDQLSEADQRVAASMQSFIQQEQQKAAIQQVIGKLTETCWDKCMSKPGTKLSNWERDCLSNCAERFLDTSIFIIEKMQRESR